MPEPARQSGKPIVLRDGPADGLHMNTDSASVLITEDSRPGEVARYRRTKRKEGERTVYGFKGWDRIVAQVAL